MRRRGLQNSPEARTSTTTVLTAIEATSTGAPLPRVLRQLAKKYVALPLWTTSRSVPAMTARIISPTNHCMKPAGRLPETAAKALLVNIKVLPAGRSYGSKRQ